MWKKIIAFAGMVGVAVATSTSAMAGKDDWAPLAEEGRDRIDSVVVKPRIGRFEKIKIVSVYGSAYVRNVKVTFRGGKTRTYRVEKFLQNRKPLNAIKLPSVSTVITKFEVEYGNSRKGPNTGLVILNGLLGPEPGGWEVMESSNVGGDDREVLLKVLPGEDRVGQLRLRGWGETLRVRSAEIVFNNGKRQRVRIRDRLEPGEATDPIDLKGYERGIKGVSLRLRQLEKGASGARIDLLGKRAPRRRGQRRRDR
ncbi:MAG: hypothetical protein K0U74_04450 [Alphaproteobacteria bacterium]|nr:hypothetical protein [Alphaproteobacteria bacterium]